VTSERGIGANSVLALAGDATSKAGALVVVIVAARLLPVAEFALLATALAAAGIIGSLLDLGAGTLLARDGARSRVHRGALLDGLLRARLPIVVAVVAGALVLGSAIGHALVVVAAVGLGVAAALAQTVHGLYRSSQDLRPEAMQRLAAAALSVGVVACVPLVTRRVDAVVVGLAVVGAATLLPLVRRAPGLIDTGARVSPGTALRLAAPIGLLALATIAYYRSGCLCSPRWASPQTRRRSPSPRGSHSASWPFRTRSRRRSFLDSRRKKTQRDDSSAAAVLWPGRW